MLANNYAPQSASIDATQANPVLDSAATCIREACVLWSAGNFDACIEETGKLALNSHTSQSIFIRARALLRVNRAADAESWLRMMQSRHSTEDALATHNMLLGNACARLNNFEHATTLFDRARSVAPHPTIVAETAYYHALALWQARDFRAARKVLQPALAAKQDIISARSAQLLGFVAIAEGKSAQACTHFWSALDALAGCVARDLHLEATILHQLAIGGAEVALNYPKRLDEHAHSMEWTTNLVMEQVQTLRHIGLAYARSGDSRLAILRFIEAGDVMPNSPWAVIGYAEAANLCYLLDEPIGASGYLRIACSVADQLRWQSVDDEGRLALLQLATVVARSGDGARAQMYLDRYHEPTRLGTRLPTLSALHQDSRLECFERHAQGVVGSALKLDDAASILSAVALAWQRLNYGFRADEARNDIRAITHRSYRYERPLSQPSPSCANVRAIDDPDDRSDAEVADGCAAEPSTNGSSPRTTSVDFGDERTKRITLTERQDAVIRLIVLGRSIEDIACELGLAPKTVRNHLSNLYLMFGVDGQLQLVATIWGDPSLRKCFAAA